MKNTEMCFIACMYMYCHIVVLIPHIPSYDANWWVHDKVKSRKNNLSLIYLNQQIISIITP